MRTKPRNVKLQLYRKPYQTLVPDGTRCSLSCLDLIIIVQSIVFVEESIEIPYSEVSKCLHLTVILGRASSVFYRARVHSGDDLKSNPDSFDE